MELGDINFESLNDVLSSLSDDDVENITRLASDFFSAGKKPDDEKKKESASEGMCFDMDMIMKVASLMNRLGSQPEDPRCRLLADLKPMLSPERRNKVDKAVQMLRMISLIPLLKELS